MGIFTKPVTACHGPRSLRRPRRALLRRASKGETDAYYALAAEYVNLISEYLYLCNLDRTEVLQKMDLLLREGWQRLPYLKRLSDWERFITTSLLAVPVSPTYSAQGARPQALMELDPQHKFALVAFDLESWDYRWLALALRVHPKDLTNVLFAARCRLLEIDLGRTPRKLRRCLALVSANFDGQLNPAQQRQAVKKLCDCDQTRAFKSRWLDHRCHLIEIRQQIRLQPAEQDDFLDGLCRDLILEEMMRPSLVTRFRNLISFGVLPGSETMPTNRDFRYGG